MNASEPIEIDDLASALEVGERELISIVGGGGKTTTLFALGGQLPGRTIMTTTTKMGSDRTEGAHMVIDPTADALAAALDAHGSVLTWKAAGAQRADGYPPERCDEWFAAGVADHLVVEADGSKRRPFKAPLDYEPVVPSSTTLMLACIGISAIGLPIEQGCFRSDVVAALLGSSPASTLTAEMAARVLLDDAGSKKALPDAARFVVLVQGIGTDDHGTFAALVDAIDGHAPVIGVSVLG